VIDPFAGSGSLGAACPPDMDLRILLNDNSEVAIKHMQGRLSASIFSKVQP